MATSQSKVTLSLEPVYKDDAGQSIPRLYDISRDDNIVHTYEPPHDPARKFRQTLAQLVYERGDLAAITVQDIIQNPKKDGQKPEPQANKTDEADHPSFTAAKLAEMRLELSNALNSAGSDIQGALDLTNLLLTTANPDLGVPAPEYIHSSITTTTAPSSAQGRPAALPSVQALKAQLVIGTKDQTLQHASEIFKAASERTIAITQRSEKYWENALRLRRSNWPLIPAPLRESLAGQILTKGMDPSAKDFWIAFGLENAPAQLQQQAVASLADELEAKRHAKTGPVDYPFGRPRQHLRVSLTSTSRDGEQAVGTNSFTFRTSSADNLGYQSLLLELHSAQQEIVERELYRELLGEAATLPSAAAQASERMITIQAALDMELTFEMVDLDTIPESRNDSASMPDGPKTLEISAIASLVRHALIIFLLRAHRARQNARQLKTSILSQFAPRTVPQLMVTPILTPVISMLQYYSFIRRLRRTFDDIKTNLALIGVPCEVTASGVNDDMIEVLRRARVFSDTSRNAPSVPLPGTNASSIPTLREREDSIKVEGESTLRIAGQHAIHFTYSSPATVFLHLPQTTIPLNDASQLHQFLVGEVSKCILEYLKTVGARLGEHSVQQANSMQVDKDQDGLQSQGRVLQPPEPINRWLVDGLEGTLVGSWHGGKIQLKVMLSERFKLTAVAIKTLRGLGTTSAGQRTTHRYPPKVGDAELVRTELEGSPPPSLVDWLEALL